jgi:1-acyl-sn-glycerol-3-phosphate acyltransferase
MAVAASPSAQELVIDPRPNRYARLLPAAWQAALVRRARGLGLASVASDLLLDYPPNDRGFDPVTTKREYFLIEQLAGRYFRVKTMGAEHIPDGRVIIVAYHSGVVPWDGLLLAAEIRRLTGRFSWNAGHELWGRYAWLRKLMVPTGMVLGGAADFDELLRRDEMCMIFVDAGEGNRRAYYLDRDRYRVKPDKGFAPGCGGYVKLALRTGSPVVPVAIVGAEEVHFCLGDVPQLADYLGLPFFPLIASPVPLPARIYIRFGEPIRFAAPPETAAEQPVVDRLNAAVRAALQALVDDTLRRRHGIYWSSYDDRPVRRGAKPAPARAAAAAAADGSPPAAAA